MPRTYAPDTGELKIKDLSNGVILETQTESGTGIRKRIEIHLEPDKPSVTLTRAIINDSFWAVELAPWAITQFRLGGTAILSLPVGNAYAAGLLPNRQLSFWPYTHLNDPRMSLRDDYILFNANSLPIKLATSIHMVGWHVIWMVPYSRKRSVHKPTPFTPITTPMPNFIAANALSNSKALVH